MAQEIDKDALLEKIVADYTRQFRDGDRPAIGDYKSKHPEFANEIEELLTSVAMIEGLKIESASGSSSSQDSVTDDLTNRKQLGDYLLIRELGRGGMGVVFEAVHKSLGRRVALKVMKSRDADNEKYITRFRREAQAAAQLHHTNIVSVFGVGEYDGYHYYVMEFIDGTPLNQVVKTIAWQASQLHQKQTGSTYDYDSVTLISGEPYDQTGPTLDRPADHSGDLTSEPRSESDAVPVSSMAGKNVSNNHQLITGKSRFRWLANVGSQIADALSYAHGQGVLHRDIKPANLLVDQQDRVWITDFGLVKFNENLDALTKTGDLIGTPQYMAPESFKGEYDQRSEVYCLGLTLYELATLRPAFKNGSTGELIHAITTTTPPPPRKIDSAVPRDLNTIIEKAISRAPSSRYENAAQLRDDLRAFSEDRPIAATQPSVFEQAWRWGRRNPLVATLAVLSAGLLCAVAATASIGYAWTTQAYSKLEVEARSTEAARTLAVENEKIAIANEKKILKEFARAEANVSLTIQAFDDILREIVSPDSAGFEFNGLGELGGIETAVTIKDAAILNQIVGFYERFAKQNTQSESLKAETAKAFRRVANINHLIGETEVAIQEYEKSLAIYKPVLEENPDSTEALLNVVDTRSELIAAIRRKEDFRRAHAENEKIVQMIEAHPKRDEPEVRLALAKSLASAGSTVVNMVAATNSSTFEESMENERFLTRFLRRRAGQNAMPMIKEHMVGVERAISIGESLIQLDAENEKYRALLSECYSSLGAVQLSLGGEEVQRGRVSISKAIEQFESLSSEYEDNLKYKYSRALTLLLLPTEEDAAPEAKKRIRQVTQIADELIGKSPNPEYKQLKVVSHIKMASLLLEAERPVEALVEQTEAYDMLQTLDREVVGRQHFRNIKLRMSANYMALARSYDDAGDRRNSGQMKKLAREFSDFGGRPPRGGPGPGPPDGGRHRGGPPGPPGPPNRRER